MKEFIELHDKDGCECMIAIASIAAIVTNVTVETEAAIMFRSDVNALFPVQEFYDEIKCIIEHAQEG